jgi:hypothetical protein
MEFLGVLNPGKAGKDRTQKESGTADGKGPESLTPEEEEGVGHVLGLSTERSPEPSPVRDRGIATREGRLSTAAGSSCAGSSRSRDKDRGRATEGEEERVPEVEGPLVDG